MKQIDISLVVNFQLSIFNFQLKKVLKGRQFPGRRWSAKHGTPAKKDTIL